MRSITLKLAVLTVMLVSANLQASTLFVANLDGAQEPTASPATGFGTVILNDAQTSIVVDLSWTGLVGGPATAAHIHCCAPAGVNAGVLFPFSGVPSATSGTIAEQAFSITATQVAELEAGLMYMNIHNAEFPGGEIRGQLIAATPEPASLGLILFGAVGLILVIRWRRRTVVAPQ